MKKGAPTKQRETRIEVKQPGVAAQQKICGVTTKKASGWGGGEVFQHSTHTEPLCASADVVL